MADPKMLKLAEYLMRGYRPAASAPTPEQMPRMSSEDYRTGQFVRGAPAKLPTAAMRRQMALAALLRRQPSPSMAARSSNPVED